MGISNKSYAIASPDDTFKPYVAFNMIFDSNFLRLSDNANSLLFAGRNDKNEFIKQASAGFDMDWTISRQHIVIKANANQNWFQNFTTLDYTGWNTQAQWNWQMGNNLNGEIGYANVQALSNFDQLNRLIPNLLNDQRYFVNAGYLFHPNGKIKLGVFRREYRFDDDSRQFSNNTEDNAELNLQYFSSSVGILGFRLLATDGRYPQRQFIVSNAQDNAYTRMNYALTWDWYFSNKTRFDGLVGYTQQNHEHLKAMDFADAIAHLNMHWQASDKALFEFSAARDIYQANNQFASFVLIQSLEFNLTFQYSSKITLKLPLSYQGQQYLGGTGAGLVGFEQQKDYISKVGFNFMYHPVDFISIGVLLNYEKRDSNYSFRSYETQSVGLNFQAFF